MPMGKYHAAGGVSLFVGAWRCGAGVGLAVAVLLGCGSLAAEGWQLRRESAEIKIYTRQSQGSALNAVRIETRLPGPIDRVADLLIDPAKRSLWDDMCATVEVLSRSQLSNTAYFHYAMPWPVADRDVVLATDIRRDEDGLTINSVALSSDYPPQPGRVRVSEAWYLWRLTPVSATATDVVAEMYMDPAGPIPAWLLNRLALSQPAKTIERLRVVLQTDR